MSEIAKTVGQRIRNYRTQLGYSQEKLAELSGCHPTYIGQVERKANIPLQCYELIASKTPSEQEQIYKILIEMDIYKNK